MNARFRRLLCVVLLVGAPVSALAQPPAAPSAASAPVVPTIDELAARVESLESATVADASVKSRVAESLSAAKSRLESARSYAARLAEMQALLKSEPQRMQEIRTGLAAEELRANYPPELPAFETISAIEQQQVKELTDLAALKSRLDDLEQQVAALGIRPTAARDQLAAAKKRRAEFESELKALAASSEPAVVADAARLAARAGLRNRENEIAMLEQELFTYDVRARLLSAERDLAARQYARAEQRAKALEDLLVTRRRAEAERAQRDAEQAQREAIFKQPLVREIAAHNAELSRELANVVAQQEALAAQRTQVAERARTVEQNLKIAERGLEVAGLSQGLGEILRSQRMALPQLSETRRDRESPKKLIGDSGVRLFRIMEEGEKLRDVDAVAEATVGEKFGAEIGAGERAQLVSEAATLLRDRQELLRKLQTAYRSYMAALGDLDFETTQLAEKTAAYAAFLDKNLIWIPSAGVIDLSTFTNVGGSLLWLLSPARWQQLGQTLSDVWRQRLGLSAGLLALFLGLLWLGRRSAYLLRQINRRVGQVQRDHYGLTPLALGLTAARAGTWPLVLIYTGELLAGAAEAPVFARAVGAALSSCAQFFLVAQFFRLLGEPNGVGKVHFRWRESSMRLVRRGLTMLLTIGLPLAAVTVVCANAHSAVYDESLGRLSFMALMLLFGVFVHRALGPRRGAAALPNASHPESWLVRLRYVWYVFLMLSIAALVVLAATGYYDTARELSRRVLATLWLLFGVALMQALLVRFLNIANRRLAFRKAVARRESQLADRGAEVQADGPMVAIDEAELDLQTIDHQTREVLSSAVGVTMVLGLVAIWAGVVPALGLLDQVALWQVSDVIDGQAASRAITLADLGVALLLGILIVVAVRNLPGVLQIVLLQRLPLTPGTRYAITTIGQYLIVGSGVIAGFGLIGLRWSDIQWLVAALGVGLGFGLQEIFANFICGIIILFEQPVRIGDTVTVGELSGTVSRIRIRATTITDWDNKEIIVPNKMFITERLVNWTLSDPITRVIVKVGIAYGSDTAKAQAVMLDVAKTNPMVLETPAPVVYFLGFGDSALDFEVRVFVRELGQRLPLIHELHMSIDKALREHGFEIPFPQRDIHIRSDAAAERPPAAAQSAPDAGPAVKDGDQSQPSLRRTGRQ